MTRKEIKVECPKCKSGKWRPYFDGSKTGIQCRECEHHQDGFADLEKAVEAWDVSTSE